MKQLFRASFLFTLLVILSIQLATALEILDSDRATLDVTISTDVSFIAQSDNAYVQEAQATLHWIPRTTYNQRIEEMGITPSGSIDDEATILLQRPKIGAHTLTLNALLSTSNDITPITTKPPFPVVVDSDLIIYTKPSEMIDSNSDISRLASSLASGKDDQYEVVFALANWVTTNIAYNLSTVTADANYPSSWVLEKRYGVCDEMTNLFISLNRALGIPARFVSGVAYTNLPELKTNWGGHGWAEVYFPEVGWVPFDTTYGEYGYVDSGHIKLRDTVDSNENSIEYTGKGYNFEIRSQPLSFDIDVLGTSPRNYEFIEVTLEPYAKTVGFGSYNMITLKAKNLREYYVSTRIDLGDTTRLEHESPDQINILLKPYEEKTYRFLVKIDNDLKRGYQYTFPVVASTKLSDPLTTEFLATENGEILSKEVFKPYFETAQKKEANVDIVCDQESPVRKESKIHCEFKGKTTEKGSACINKRCENVVLPATLDHTISQETPGLYTYPVSFSTTNAQKSSFITISVLDETHLDIINVTAPKTIRYDEQEQIAFLVEKRSKSSPEEGSVKIVHKYFSQEWSEPIGLFALKFQGNRLHSGLNDFEIIVSYTDGFGVEHQEKETVTIELVDLTLAQKVTVFFDSLEFSLRSFFEE